MPISNLALIRSTVAALAVGFAVLIFIVGINLWLVDRTSDYSDSVNLARQQRSAIVDLRNILVDAETGQRGFLITGNPDYLAPYRAALDNLAAQVKLVQSVFATSPRAQDDLRDLDRLAAEKIAELEKTVALAQAGRSDEALSSVRSNRGKELMDQLRSLLSGLLARTERRMDEALRNQQSSMDILQWVTVGGALVILLVMGGAVWAVILYTRQLVVAQREVQALNANLENRVNERTADLARANEEIQRFAYVVTHDLRAPLVNIMGFTSELEGNLQAIQSYVGANMPAEESVAQGAREAANKDLPEALRFIRSSTHKMDGLITAILKLSREGKRVLRPEPLDLRKLIEGAADNIRHKINEVEGVISLEGEFPPIVSDRLALEQIFGNLLDNAVKYRAPGRPLALRVRGARQRGNRVYVEIEDNGRGIAKQDHERVFDLFRRAGAQDQPGEGLGLAYVRTLVRNLGGEVTLTSELGRGTTIMLNFLSNLPSAMGVVT